MRVDGNVLSAACPTASYQFLCDALGRVTQTTINMAGLAPSVTLGQTWDFNSNRASLTATVGGATDLSNIYQYNTLEQLESIQQTGNTLAPKMVTFGYYDNGLLKSIEDSFGTSPAPVIRSTYTYDADSRLTGLVYNPAGQDSLASYTWQYDNAGRISSSSSTTDSSPGASGLPGVPGVVSYTYDNDNELLTASYEGYTHAPPDESIIYDPNGNRTSANGVASTVGTGNLVTFDGTYHYQYDGEGNRIARWKTNDPSVM
jgi:hypothetical protein